MNIYVLRHGQTDLNLQGRFQGRLDIEINKTGEEQVEIIKKELQKIDFDIVIVSPLKRTIQTANIVTDKELIIDDRLIERSFGKLEGQKSILNYEEQCEKYEIETIENMKKRIYGFIDEIKTKYIDKKNILLVTHESVAQIIDSYFNTRDDIKEFRIGNGKYEKYTIEFDKEKLMKKLEEIEIKRGIVTEKRQQLLKDYNKKNSIHIVYLMIWTKVCGGTKIILEYANRLSQKGHKITLISFDEKPVWFNLDKKINFIKVSEDELIEKHIPDCDLIVATSWKNIYQGVKSKKAPVVFFEQGGSHIFNVENLPKEKYNAVKNRINLVNFIYTVSNYTKTKIKEYYQQNSNVIYNAIDSNIFYFQEKKNHFSINITIIGSEKFKFKNIGETIEVISILKKKYENINLIWISQDKPNQYLDERVIINPKQIEIGNILRETDIYICNSEYESFCLPVLEALACGAAVITTDNGGIRDFVEDNYNALIIESHNKNDMIKKIELLIKDEEKREYLVNNGVKTAKKFNWEQSINKIEEYYLDIAQYKLIN